MKKLHYIVACCFILGTLLSFRGAKEKIVSMLGKTVPDFGLPNVDGQMCSLSSNAKGYIVVFTCNHCPFAKLYPKRLNDLNSKYAPLGVPLVAINSMDTIVYEDERFDLMQAKAKEWEFTFPYLQDAAQTVGKSFAANHTPHAFVIWRANNAWVVEYAGAIDDNGDEPEKANSFLAKAVDELLTGKKPSMPETSSFGCRIFYRK
ncbi:MAG: thioredoxin family protein [Phycisphaerales bacterium]|nr:thioredoxin family protein [Phycisphaerales bacterium]